jgi:Fe-Mn family superoxide dismutase
MTTHIDRRQFAAAAFAATALCATTGPVRAAAQPAAGGRPAAYQVKPLPFNPANIRGLSERLLRSHYDNNSGGAVRRLHAIQTQLASLDWATAPNFLVNGLKREELIAMNSMILHELYFDCIGGGGNPEGALEDAIRRDFGSVERWRAEFTAMGKAQGGGSGWTLLTYSRRDGRLVNAWAADHTHTVANGQPLLALDMYEHSYHIDYGPNAGAYVDAFMQVIRWDTVSALFERTARG